ncbi:hypothetical protein BHM03_00018200 [Ensete ventricosum]|uniref:Homeobox domain-containing protein n=1 Tax=Ensete ventricosum TaxID=4639 RepID=A0A445MFA8_ENSVE|nr:hypothetical protein BHM03_00018200 [Ensete ventricosum]
MAMVVSGKEAGKGQQAAAAGMDAGKYVRYTPEQVEALERVYTECPKPSSLRRKQLIRECPILSNIEPKQIKVWFQNRRHFSYSLLAIAEETLAEFLSKATGTAVDWVQMVGMKVADILKDRSSWYRDCRCLDVLTVIPTGNGGNIELIYMQVCSHLLSLLSVGILQTLHGVYLRFLDLFNKCNSFPPAYVIQNVPPAILVQFLREHRSEWADCGVDAYSAASLTANPYAVPAVRPSGGFLGSQVILPLAHTVEHEEDSPAATRTLDLASTLEIGSGVTARAVNETASSTYNLRSVLTIAFQFTYENHLRDSVAEMARQYVRSVVASVQRVAMAIAPSRPGSQIGVKHPPGSPEAHTLARWISGSYR